MPKGKQISADIKREALAAYYSGSETVNQICARYGIAKRTMYDWIEQKGHGVRVHNAKQPRKDVRLSAEEAEIILYMIEQCEPHMTTDQRVVVLPLEERLLTVSDILYEMSH